MRRSGYQVCAVAVSVALLAVPTGAVSGGQQFSDETQAPRAVPPERPPVSGQMTPPPPQSESRTPEAIGLRGFSVSLVLGETQGAATPDSLPAGAKKAIADMRDFLHYKSYRMLDVQWTLCCSGRVPTGITGRLRGLEEDDHWFQVWIREIAGNRMSVAFQLRDAEGREDAESAAVITRVERDRRIGELRNQRDQLAAEYAAAQQKYGENHPQQVNLRARLENVKRQLDEAEKSHAQGRGGYTATTSRRSTHSRMLLDNTFSMEVGETVVIGTSRLKGDKALIALLTAASRPGSPGR